MKTPIRYEGGDKYDPIIRGADGEYITTMASKEEAGMVVEAVNQYVAGAQIIVAAQDLVTRLWRDCGFDTTRVKHLPEFITLDTALKAVKAAKL